MLLVHRLDRGFKSHNFLGAGGRSAPKSKISAQINPWRVVDFSSDIFLVQSSLGKTLIYSIAYVISTILTWLPIGLLGIVC